MTYIKETKRRMGFLETNPSCGSCKHFRDRETKQGSIMHEGSCKYSRTCSFGVEKKYYCSRYSPSGEPEDLSDQDVANLSYEELIESLFGNPEEGGEARPKSLSDQDIRNIMHSGFPFVAKGDVKIESPEISASKEALREALHEIAEENTAEGIRGGYKKRMPELIKEANNNKALDNAREVVRLLSRNVEWPTFSGAAKEELELAVEQNAEAQARAMHEYINDSGRTAELDAALKIIAKREAETEGAKLPSEDSKRFYIEVPSTQALAWDESQERITELEKALAYISEQEGCTAIGAFAEGKLKKEGRC